VGGWRIKVGPVEWRGGAGGEDGDVKVKAKAKARTQTQIQAQPGDGAAAVGKGYCGRERRRQGGGTANVASGSKLSGPGWSGRDGSGRAVEYPEAQMGILAREWSGRRERDGGPRAARTRNEGILCKQPGRRQVQVLGGREGREARWMGWRRAVTVGMERVFLGSMQRRRPAPHARPDAAGVRQAGQHPRAGTGTGGIGSRAGGFAARGPCRVHQLPASSQLASPQCAPTRQLQPAPTPSTKSTESATHPSTPVCCANATQKAMQSTPPTPRRCQARSQDETVQVGG
jgi:hypothetical protein